MYLTDTGEISGAGQKLFHCEVRNMNIGPEATICPCRFFILKDPKTPTGEEMTPDQAQKIINALQIGIPPSCGIDVFGCALQKTLISTHLEDVYNGFSHSLFVVGDYGTGKSHLLQFIFNQALENDFVVSKISLKPECNFYREIIVYSEIIRNLSVPDNSEIDAIDWLARKVGKIQLPNIPQNLAIALEKAADCSGQNRRLLLDYISGIDVPVSEFRKLVKLPRIKIKLEDDDFMPLIKGITKICLHDYSGLVILFDEVENVVQSSITYSQTEKAISNIARLVDSIQDLHNVYFVFAVTPDVFDILKKRGVISNKATATPLSRLSKEDMLDLAQQIRKIHCIAFNSEAQAKKFDSTIEKIAKDAITKHSNIREFVKTLISILDAE
jgi:hypothetical protein